jgi:hypothetical protein
VTVLGPVVAVAWLVWVKSPPPQADAVFVTLIAEFAGMFTFSVIVG